ncbi:MAG: site-specific integrase [Anaerolineae bacterium]|nr:site-specific integrase [Anaerolineae bacterium]
MTTEPRPKKLLDPVNEAIRRKHYSPRTEETYIRWIKRFIRFHHKRQPAEMAAAEVQACHRQHAAESHPQPSPPPFADSAGLGHAGEPGTLAGLA